MFSDPRRVGRIEVAVTLPANGSEKDQKILEKVGDNCPVIKSIHPDIELMINYNWESKIHVNKGAYDLRKLYQSLRVLTTQTTIQ